MSILVGIFGMPCWWSAVTCWFVRRGALIDGCWLMVWLGCWWRRWWCSCWGCCILLAAAYPVVRDCHGCGYFAVVWNDLYIIDMSSPTHSTFTDCYNSIPLQTFDHILLGLNSGSNFAFRWWFFRSTRCPNSIMGCWILGELLVFCCLTSFWAWSFSLASLISSSFRSFLGRSER